MKFKLCIVVLMASIGQFAAAACMAPAEPALPNAETAVLAEMVKAAKDVKAFIAEANKYLGCVQSTQAHDKMVDRMHVVADDFNGLTTMFKARAKTAVAAN